MTKKNDTVSLREVYDIVTRLETKIDDRLNDLDIKYVTKVEFWPVRTIVYSGASIMLIGVVGAILSMVLKK